MRGDGVLSSGMYGCGEKVLLIVYDKVDSHILHLFSIRHPRVTVIKTFL